MAREFRVLDDGDDASVTDILDAAYGPSPGRLERVRRYRSLGEDTWLLAVEDGVDAGMGGAIDFGGVGYVGLVGVHPSMQRRGIAEALMRSLLALLEARDCRTVLLDASEVGAPLYRKLGFVDDGDVRLYAKSQHEPYGFVDARPMAAGDLAGVSALDRRATGVDRTQLLARYFEEAPSRAFVAEDGGRVAGFAVAQAYTIGPWVATSADAARRALAGALSCAFEQGVTVAVPPANVEAAGLLEAEGFAHTRTLGHMRLGPPIERLRELVYGQASLAAG